MSAALLLIDIQNDYFPGGTMELAAAAAAADRAAALLAACRGKGLPVFHVQHLSTRPGASFFLPGTPGCQIHAAVAPLEGEAVITKHYPNSFRETTLLEQLRGAGITELVIAGMMTHMCVDSTVRAAADLGYACTLAHDACATRDLSFAGKTIAAAQVHSAFVAALHGLFAKAAAAAEIAAALKDD